MGAHRAPIVPRELTATKVAQVIAQCAPRGIFPLEETIKNPAGKTAPNQLGQNFAKFVLTGSSPTKVAKRAVLIAGQEVIKIPTARRSASCARQDATNPRPVRRAARRVMLGATKTQAARRRV